jgi:metal-responsive CopG/Arc/MetJ family transcriptional regulator
MRVHIEIDKPLVDRIDEAAGERGRSEFVRRAVIAALESRERLELIHTARGSISAAGHEWDKDPAGWVRAQRRGDKRRIG